MHSIAEKMRLLEPTTKNLNEDRPILSGYIGIMRIFAGIPWGGASNDNGVVTAAIFSIFDGYFFGNFRDEASISIQRHAVRPRLIPK